MAKRPTLKVSKTDAAKRQLETAIRLWFFSGEPVSIHTLTAAAHQVLHDIGKKRGVPTMLRGLSEGVRPEYRKRVRQAVSRFENFFKHADSDPNSLLDFNPEATDMFLFDAVYTYEKLTQEIPPTLGSFKAWMLIHNPELMDEQARQNFIKTGVDFTHMTTMTKAEFFTLHQAHLLQRGIT